MTVGAVSGPVSTATGTANVTITNGLLGTATLTLASHTSVTVATVGERLTINGDGNTVISGAITQASGKTLALTYSGTTTLTLNGSRSFTVRPLSATVRWSPRTLPRSARARSRSTAERTIQRWRI